METEYPDVQANSTEFEYFPAISTVIIPMCFIIIKDKWINNLIVSLLQYRKVVIIVQSLSHCVRVIVVGRHRSQ